MDTTLRDRSEPAAVAGVRTLVDAALARASQREVFTRDEALDLLHGLLTEIGDSSEAVMVEEAVAGYGDALLIPRSHVVDPLLDLRLALAG